MDISNLLLSGDVERFHTCSGLSNQRVSEHSWGVALFCEYLDPNCSKYVLLVAMTHDCAEMVTGDIPSTAKWREPKLKVLLDRIEKQVEVEWGINWELKDSEKDLLKAADFLEGLSYCVKRYHAGEKEAMVVIKNWLNHYDDVLSYRFSPCGFFNDLGDYISELKEGIDYECE